MARASTTAVRVSCSWRAKPLTVSTRLGIRSARRWYWFSTWDQAAFTCSSYCGMLLMPQPVSSQDMKSTAASCQVNRECCLCMMRSSAKGLPPIRMAGRPESSARLAEARVPHRRITAADREQARSYGRVWCVGASLLAKLLYVSVVKSLRRTARPLSALHSAPASAAAAPRCARPAVAVGCGRPPARRTGATGWPPAARYRPAGAACRP